MDSLHHLTEELIPNQIDRNAEVDPDRVLIEYSQSPSSYDSGFVKVTTTDFSNAVNGAAHWLERSLGGKSKHFECLAYIGQNDLRYFALIAGAVKAGYKTLLLSPRNSIQAQKALIAKTKCQAFITTNPTPAAAEAVVRALPDFKTLTIPSLEELLFQKHPHYLYDKKYADAADDPLVIVHTSGSTGIPKPITYSHRFACRLVNIYRLRAPDGFWAVNSLWTNQRIYQLMPPFHAGGVINFMGFTFLGNTVVLPAASIIPQASALIDVLRQTKFTIAQLTPATIVELANEPEMMDELVSLGHEYIFFSGGDLPIDVGNKISRRFKLYTIMGSTEIGVWPQLRKLGEWDHENWKYMAPRPNTGIEFRKTADDLFQQFIVRKPELMHVQPVFTIFPHLEEYDTNDLYSQHPTNPGLYTFRGRADDIIVFLNGEKTNPTSFQNLVTSHPQVTGTLLAGAQRWEACLLIELRGLPSLSSQERSTVLEDIWPLIDEANQQCPAHSRVSRALVLFVKPEKPMLRSGKGSIQRAATLTLYQDEISALYEDAAKLQEGVDVEKITLDSPETLAVKITEEIQKITSWEEFGPDDDFFTRGMDSLHVLTMSRNLGAATQLRVAPSTIYANASSKRLARALMDLVAQENSTDTDRMAQVAKSVLGSFEKMKAELDLLLLHDPLITDADVDLNGYTTTQKDNERKHTVLLTGSTGGIGTYLLDQLLKNPAVSYIFCLNRSKDSKSVQLERTAQRSLSTESFGAHVAFLTASLDHGKLGLSDDDFASITSSVTTIIHNAWPVNFNLPLDAFEPALRGLVNLAGLAASSAHNASLLFVSSIGSVVTLSKSLKEDAQVAEEVVSDPLAASGMPYGQSKQIAERLVDYATTQYGVRGSAVRVGQVAGPVLSEGHWAKQEWLPSLVISSKYMGALPASLSPISSDDDEPKEIDWIPVDILAKILLEFVLHDPDPSGERSGAAIFHALNPRPVTWSSLLPTLLQQLDRLPSSTDKGIEILPLEQWIARLRQSGTALETDGSDMEALLKANPALKLLSFYEGMATKNTTAGESGKGSRLSLTKSLRASSQLRSMQSVTPEWMCKWLEGWFSK